MPNVMDGYDTEDYRDEEPEMTQEEWDALFDPNADMYEDYSEDGSYVLNMDTQEVESSDNSGSYFDMSGYQDWLDQNYGMYETPGNAFIIDPDTGNMTDGVTGDDWWQQRDGTFANINTGEVYDPNAGSLISFEDWQSDNSYAANPQPILLPYTPVVGSPAIRQQSSTPAPSGSGGTFSMPKSSSQQPNPTSTAANAAAGLVNSLLSNLGKVLSAPKTSNQVAPTGQARLPGTTSSAANRSSLPTSTSNLPKATSSGLSTNNQTMLLIAAAVTAAFLIKKKSYGRRPTTSR